MAAFDYDFDTSAASCGPTAWAVEVDLYRNALLIANLENHIVQAKSREEFETLFSLLVDAQSRRNELAIRRLEIWFYPTDRKEEV